MTLLRLALVALAAAILVQASLAADAKTPWRTRTVPCAEIIDQTAFPYVGGPQYRHRLVLGQFSVPAARLPQPEPTGERAWPFFGKSGMVVRADGRPTSVTVPRAWRDRVAIVWGNGGNGVLTSIRFAGCPGGEGVGNAYAGGFLVRSRPVCVPLIFRIGDRTAVVRFGLGRRCG